MKKLLIVALLLICSNNLFADLKYTNIPHLDTAIYYYNINVKEATNKNDGPVVEKFLSYVGLGKGYPWCAAFVSYCIGVCDDIITKIKSASALSFRVNNSIQESKVRKNGVKIPSGYLAVWKRGNTANGHIGIVYKWRRSDGLVIEGNSSDAVSFVHRNLEPRNYFRIRWFTPIIYKKEKQAEINKIKLNWLENISKQNSNFNLTR